MRYLFDTSSLSVLARYYQPFDKDNELFEWFKGKFDAKEIVVLDAIIDESRYLFQGLIVKTFPFLLVRNDLIINTSDLLPNSPRRFDNLVNNNFSIRAIADNGKVDFSVLKQKFLLSGDGKLILYAYNCLQNSDSEFCIVTEETRNPNDNKARRRTCPSWHDMAAVVSSLPSPPHVLDLPIGIRGLISVAVRGRTTCFGGFGDFGA